MHDWPVQEPTEKFIANLNEWLVNAEPKTCLLQYETEKTCAMYLNYKLK